jgi:hypothetical protein
MPIPREIGLPGLIPVPHIGQPGRENGLRAEVSHRIPAVAGLDGKGADDVCVRLSEPLDKIEGKVSGELTVRHPDGTESPPGDRAAVVHLLVSEGHGWAGVITVKLV